MTADLFGQAPAQGQRDHGSVRLALTHFPHRDTPLAVFLSATGREDDGRHAPVSKLARGVGPNINVWTMPRWVARDRGWL
jgi:hypothetical protein